jgi:hypothetical protein
MGNNAAGALGSAYTPGKQLDLRNNPHWQMYEATKRDDKGANTDVTIFKFLKSQADKAHLAQRGVQKLRTMKHPYILSFLDSNSEDKDSLLLVAEACIPLGVWLSNALEKARTSSSSDTTDGEDRGSLLNEALWGYRCVVNALDFLHTKCNIAHHFIGMNSIFVVRNGDWKIGFLDFAANPAQEKAFLREAMSR